MNPVINCIEDDYPVTVIGAWITGSRSLGYNTQNSDYDITIVYQMNNKNRYILDTGIKDTIDTEYSYKSQKADVHGWDIQKFSTMVTDGNVNAVEALRSPKPIRMKNGIENIREIITNRFNVINYIIGCQSFCEKAYNKFQKTSNQKYIIIALRYCLLGEYVQNTTKVDPYTVQNLVDSSQYKSELSSTITNLLDNRNATIGTDNLNKFINIIESFISQSPGSDFETQRLVRDDSKKLYKTDLVEYLNLN